jgi:transcriptional regulator with XRE-family HTH domain
MTDAPQSLDQLCAKRGIDAKQLAALASLDEPRVTAILLGRWTPSPDERDSIAAVFGLTREQIVWGHKTPIQHLYGAGPA